MIRWQDGTWSHLGSPLCPDLARLDWFGVADNRRGRLVRLFFRVLDRIWPVR
jgi:hypothetical protein